MTGAQHRQRRRLARRLAAGGWRDAAQALLDEIDRRRGDHEILAVIVCALAVRPGAARWSIHRALAGRLAATPVAVVEDAAAALAREAAALRAQPAAHYDA